MTVEPHMQQGDGLESVVGRVAGLLEHGGGALTSGDVASLRRMDPRRPSAAFFKLAGAVLDGALPTEPQARTEAETRWAAIIAGMACLGDLHRRRARLGSALVDAGYSELRFARLLRADGDRLVDDLPMLARFLTAKGVPADWTQAAWLILSADRSDDERARRNLAHDYYGALARKTNT